LNIRGNDVPFNPLVISYLFITTKQAILFVDKAKISPEIATYLKSQNVSVREYGDVWSFLRRAEWGDGKVHFSLYCSDGNMLVIEGRYPLGPH
jgi:Xaa-Pro aminopeptidase